ncbi:MAG: hypothetical protein Q6K90_07355 [Gloeomargarita sp. HHBFW_bins_162]
MTMLQLYLALMTVVWLVVLLAVVLPALTTGTLGITEAKTTAGQLLAGAVLTLPGSLGLAIGLSWGCFWRRWERWAFYCSLLPVLNVLVAGIAWLWELQANP